ncbi:MAG: isocitrate lyase/phosphoenolpyruvate mutase family protein [Actinomycetota bacterium]
MREHQIAAGAAFRALHDGPGIFVLPCAWNVASARLFEAAGFAAIGTTSGGVNWSRGRPDYVYSTPREIMLGEYGEIASSVAIPTSGDLENGYGIPAEDVANTIGRSIELGMVGGSIEDQAPGPEPGLLPLELSVERIAAAREAADRSGVPYVLTARAESLYGGVDRPMDDAIERITRYRAAGADCLFVPGVADVASIAHLVEAIDAPISVGIGSGGAQLTLDVLADIGVRRVSTGGSMPRAMLGFLRQACAELIEHGSFSFAERAIPEDELNTFLG